MFLVLSIIAAIFIFAFLYKVFTHKTPEQKGRAGEEQVAADLSLIQNTDRSEGCVINDILFETSDGNSCQIDHVYIRKNGVWVIETKNYAGSIFGNETSEFWTQVLAYGNVKNSFRNPLKQNKTHIFRLSQYLGIKGVFKTLIVFSDKSDITNVQAEHVINKRYLRSTILSDTDNIVSDAQIRTIYSALCRLKENRTIEIEQHIKNIHKKQDDLAHGICPRCGGNLILRNGKYGQFLACCNYSKCKFTKKI